MNIVLLRGCLPKDLAWRQLPDGTAVAELDVTTRTEAGVASVNVSWPGAKPGATLPQGAEVIVVGRVRRRFFRSGGATASKTEVVADAVVPARQTKRAATAVETALVTLGALGGPTR